VLLQAAQGWKQMYRKNFGWNAPRLAPLVMAASLLLISTPAHAQQQQPNYYGGSNASALSGKTVFLPAGTTFEGRLDKTIGSSASRQGQVFEIEITSPVLANGTEMIIPSGSKVDGEVVEAIPSGRLPHKKGYVKPTGKLRTQLTLLHTPDGMTYPLVASLAPEEIVQGTTKKRNNMGNSVGYVGSQASFDAVAPGASNRFSRFNNQRGPQVVTKQDLQRDPLYGKDQSQDQNDRGGEIRSLMKKGHEIYIYSGSPVTIKLDGPLKIGVAYEPGSEASFNAAREHAMQENTGGRRFSHSDTTPQLAPTPGGDGQSAAPEQTNNPLPFLQPGYHAPSAVPGGSVIPGAVPGAAPYGGQPVAAPPQYQQQPQPQGAPGSTF
jgi:hypothetical protein